MFLLLLHNNCQLLMFLTGWEKEIVTGANLVVDDLLLPVNQAFKISIIPKKIIQCNSVDADLLPVNKGISFHLYPRNSHMCKLSAYTRLLLSYKQSLLLCVLTCWLNFGND
jgi:hypothetical protein